MARQQKEKKVVEAEKPWELPEHRKEGAMRVRNHCLSLFQTTTAVEIPHPAPRHKPSGKGIVLTPRGEGAKEAFDRDIDAMLIQLDDDPNDTWDEM